MFCPVQLWGGSCGAFCRLLSPPHPTLTLLSDGKNQLLLALLKCTGESGNFLDCSTQVHRISSPTWIHCLLCGGEGACILEAVSGPTTDPEWFFWLQDPTGGPTVGMGLGPLENPKLFFRGASGLHRLSKPRGQF